MCLKYLRAKTYNNLVQYTYLDICVAKTNEEYRRYFESGERRLPSVGPFLSKPDRVGAWSRRLEKRGRSLGTFDDRKSKRSGKGGIHTCPIW